jgi:excisionase family DNA binding protein
VNEPGNHQRQRRTVLPASLPPRGLSRVQAAEYVGVSASMFDKMIAAGEMPAPKRFGARTVWDRKALDCAFDAFDDDEANEWDI